MNETSPGDGNASDQVDSNSIFRVASISKHIATLSGLVVENESRAQSDLAVLSLDTPVRQALPQFGLPDIDWHNGGSEITLSMLVTHSSGLPREGYLTDFNMVKGLAKADAETIGAEWAGVEPSEVIESIKQRNLMFAPGQRAACEPSISQPDCYVHSAHASPQIPTLVHAFSPVSIAWEIDVSYHVNVDRTDAVANYHNQLASTNQTWTEYATQKILKHLNMTHSFFGAIPKALVSNIGVPGVPHWVDLLIGPGYDPAGGMWASS